jgi:hypothetical protein
MGVICFVYGNHYCGKCNLLPQYGHLGSIVAWNPPMGNSLPHFIHLRIVSIAQLVFNRLVFTNKISDGKGWYYICKR